MGKKSLDKQLSYIPKEVKFCKNCVVSNQRPRTKFNEEGICSACQWSFEKDNSVDWKTREQELVDLCNKFRKNNGEIDVIVPSSGGKDSAFVAHQLKHRFNMNPLCVTWAPFEWTNIGWTNLQDFVSSGFNNIIGMADGVFHRKLSKLAFEYLGDAWEPFAYGQLAYAYHIAEKFNVELIFYGENGELEYGGVDKYKNRCQEDVSEWQHQYYKGSGVDKLVDIGIETGLFNKNDIKEKTTQFYKAPSPEIIKEKKIERHWYSYYQKWTPQENFYYAMKYTNFTTNSEGRSEGTYTKYASLDDKADGFHFYLSYMKFGLGRASRDAQQDIRRHHITRDEGLALVRRFDGEFPQRHFKWFLKYLDINEEFFWNVMDFYREQSNAWEKVNGKWVMKFPVQ
jgi:N-acetyl sugar amidotransferase